MQHLIYSWAVRRVRENTDMVLWRDAEFACSRLHNEKESAANPKCMIP